jgi:hypothetical protein
MNEEPNQLVKMDTEHLIRQVASFGVLRPLIVTFIGAVCVLKGALLLGVPILLLGLIPLINALKWNGRVFENLRRDRPLAMKVFFSKRNQMSPFMDLKASFDDQRGFNPFMQFFQPHWNLLGANWDASNTLGDAKECLVYLDRENGQVFAFRLDDKVLFVKPYVLMPWRKLDVRALIGSGKAADAELRK